MAQVQQALLDPRQLLAGERAVIAGTPTDENELVAAQLKHLDRALESSERERARLLDAYQAGLLELDELTRRTAAITTRRDKLASEKDALTERSAELATENRLRRRLTGFAERVAASLDDLDIEARRRLLRESPWFWWRLWRFVFRPGPCGPGGSVEALLSCF